MKYLLLAILLYFITLVIAGCAWCAPINDQDAITAIVGEASGERVHGSPLPVMRAIASAIRNRGTLKGVYGLHAAHVSKEPSWVFTLAAEAWSDSLHYDFASRCTSWEGTAFQIPYWTRNMDLVMTIGNTNFYREKGK